MRILIDTSDYERSHGKSPRGYGNWMFCSVRPGSSDYLDHLVSHTGRYADAKRFAVAYAATDGGKALGFRDVVYVCA